MTWKADFITCPHCGYVDEEMSEYPWGPKFEKDEDEVETMCTWCDKWFVVTLHIDSTFSTSKDVKPKVDKL